MKFISSPYGNSLNKEQRMIAISNYSANQLKSNIHVICPMTLGIALAKNSLLPENSVWWISWTLDLLSRCDEMDVLCFSGWENSIGVKAEINFALSKKIPINYINIEELLNNINLNKN